MVTDIHLYLGHAVQVPHLDSLVQRAGDEGWRPGVVGSQSYTIQPHQQNHGVAPCGKIRIPPPLGNQNLSFIKIVWPYLKG